MIDNFTLILVGSRPSNSDETQGGDYEKGAKENSGGI